MTIEKSASKDNAEKERNEAMIDFERLAKEVATEHGFRLHAERLQLWRLCSNAARRRAEACRDEARCRPRLADWAEAVKGALPRDATHNPDADAIRLELLRRIERLNQSAED
jgi:hypothetical protein